jgi:hypothetical protein
MDTIYNYNLGNCGMSFQGAISKEYLDLLKRAIKKDSCYPDSQSSPMYEIIWECKSDEDAIKHGYPKGYWDQLKTMGATIVKIEETGWGIHAVTHEFVMGSIGGDIEFIDKIEKIKNEEMRAQFVVQCLRDEEEYKKEIPTLSWNKARKNHLIKICKSIAELRKKYPQYRLT